MNISPPIIQTTYATEKFTGRLRYLHRRQDFEGGYTFSTILQQEVEITSSYNTGYYGGRVEWRDVPVVSETI